jgi:hypothetical protein
MALLAAIGAGIGIAKTVSGIFGRKKKAKRAKRELQKQQRALEEKKKFAVEQATEQGRRISGQARFAGQSLAGVQGGAGTSTTIGLEEGEENIRKDIEQIGANFDQQIAGLGSQIDEARSQEKFSFGDALSVAGSVVGGVGGINQAGGFSGLGSQIGGLFGRRRKREARRATPTIGVDINRSPQALSGAQR